MICEEMEVMGDARHDRPAHRPEQRAIVAGLHRREFLDALLDALPYRVEDAGPLSRRGATPSVERIGGGMHGRVRLGWSAASDVGDRRLVDRRDVAECVGGRSPLSSDEVVGGDLDVLDDDAVVRQPPPPDRTRNESRSLPNGRSHRRTCQASELTHQKCPRSGSVASPTDVLEGARSLGPIPPPREWGCSGSCGRPSEVRPAGAWPRSCPRRSRPSSAMARSMSHRRFATSSARSRRLRSIERSLPTVDQQLEELCHNATPYSKALPARPRDAPSMTRQEQRGKAHPGKTRLLMARIEKPRVEH